VDQPSHGFSQLTAFSQTVTLTTTQACFRATFTNGPTTAQVNSAALILLEDFNADNGAKTFVDLYGLKIEDQDLTTGTITNLYGIHSENRAVLENPATRTGAGENVLTLNQLDTTAANTAHILFNDKTADPAAPVQGQMWRNDDALNFQATATGTVDLVTQLMSTANDATLTLTDDASDQTLTGSLGTLRFDSGDDGFQFGSAASTGIDTANTGHIGMGVAPSTTARLHVYSDTTATGTTSTILRLQSSAGANGGKLEGIQGNLLNFGNYSLPMSFIDSSILVGATAANSSGVLGTEHNITLSGVGPFSGDIGAFVARNQLAGGGTKSGDYDAFRAFHAISGATTCGDMWSFRANSLGALVRTTGSTATDIVGLDIGDRAIIASDSGEQANVLTLTQNAVGNVAGVHINLNSKVGDPPSPAAGDIWRNGGAFKFATSASGTFELSDDGSDQSIVGDLGELNIQSGDDTYLFGVADPTIDAAGHARIGVGWAPQADATIYVRTNSSATQQAANAMSFILQSNATSATPVAGVKGIMEVWHGDQPGSGIIGSIDFINNLAAIAERQNAFAAFYDNTTGSYAINGDVNMFRAYRGDDLAAAPRTFANMYGLHIESLELSNGTITNLYGIHCAHKAVIQSENAREEDVLRLDQLAVDAGDDGAHIFFNDKTTDPTALTAGQFWRNGNDLKYEGSGGTQVVVWEDETQTLTNKTLTATTNKLRYEKTIPIETPVVGDDIAIVICRRNQSIVSVESALSSVAAGQTVTWNMVKGTDYSAAGSDLFTADQVTAAATVTVDTPDTTAVSDGDIVRIQILAGTANIAAGDVVAFTFHFEDA
jgi:hypothetical protein